LLFKPKGTIGTGSEHSQSAGERIGENCRFVTLAGASNQVITGDMMVAGVIERTGPIAAYADTFDSATNIIAAMGDPDPGNSFFFTVLNTVAFANVIGRGEGILIFNTDILASYTKQFMAYVMSDRPRQVYNCNTHSNNVINGLTNDQLDSLSAGMSVIGSGMPNGTLIVGINKNTLVNPYSVIIGPNAATSTLTGVSLIFSPTVTIRGLFEAAV
jgi:hypothetical protein